MREETESGNQTLDSSSETIELRFRQEPEMDTRANETSADELTLRLVGERIKQATDPILRRIEEICAPLASRTEVEAKRPARGVIMSVLAPHLTGTTASSSLEFAVSTIFSEISGCSPDFFSERIDFCFLK